MLGLVAAVSFFETYDMYLFSLNLKQIQAELGLAEGSLGTLGSLVRIGSLLAIFIVPLADRFGRRRILLSTVLGYTVMTALTALAPSAQAFVALQLLARAFGTAEALLATVVIVEEFPAEHRGWGIGAASAIQACGAGFASVMFGFVDALPFGWRMLYAVGVLPLCLIAYWRRTLPETERFNRFEHARHDRLPMFGHVVQAARDHTRSFYLLLGTFFVLAVAGSGPGFFTSKFLQDVHGWTPPGVAMLTFFGGAFAIIGNPLAGWLSDRFGRRGTGTVFMAAHGVALLAFYSLTGVWLLPLLWIASVFFSMGSGVTLSAYSAELFPTSMRSSASGATSLAAPLGTIVGLAAVSALYDLTGSLWRGVLMMGALMLLLPPVIWFLFPETARRELDDIAVERER
jgi:putative MFS transporter